MLHYEDVGEPSNSTLALLSAHGYVESERDEYAHWKDVSYTNGEFTFTFNYSRRAGNLKTVYVASVKEVWRSNVDLHTTAMHFNSRIAKYLPGDTFTDKLHALIANPEPYCVTADAEESAAMRKVADAFDRAYALGH